jgi:hypothetical protein
MRERVKKGDTVSRGFWGWILFLYGNLILLVGGTQLINRFFADPRRCRDRVG